MLFPWDPDVRPQVPAILSGFAVCSRTLRRRSSVCRILSWAREVAYPQAGPLTRLPIQGVAGGGEPAGRKPHLGGSSLDPTADVTLKHIVALLLEKREVGQGTEGKRRSCAPARSPCLSRVPGGRPAPAPAASPPGHGEHAPQTAPFRPGRGPKSREGEAGEARGAGFGVGRARRRASLPMACGGGPAGALEGLGPLPEARLTQASWSSCARLGGWRLVPPLQQPVWRVFKNLK